MNIPYTYLIGWSNLNTYYYGVRYSKDCNPSDLWVTYFTSSDHVKEFRSLHGDPDIIQIRKTFNKPKDARLWECKVLKRMDVVNKQQWINRHDNMSPPIVRRFGDENVMRRPELRDAIRGENNPARKEGVGDKISKKLIGRTGTFTNKTHSEETKALMKNRWNERKESGWTSKPMSNEQKEKISVALKGRMPSPDAVEKMKRTLNENASRNGGKNPAAKPLIFCGIKYDYIRQASMMTGLSIYKILKECEFL
jgi:NUMOD3 motif